MNDDPENDNDAEEELDRLSESIADKLVSKIIIWLVRTILGLTLFGALWYFFDWAFWLFWGYLIISPISLIFTIYLHLKLADHIADLMEEQSEED